jgi:pyruvate/2-oxoglutarate dehydrogenase complex dihydrolipoamide dehydrogenase (E3) component
MVIIGGGYIGTEMAGIMAAFGVKVTLLVRDMLLARVDQEIVDLLIENMKKHHIDVRILANSNEVTKNPETGLLNVHLEDGSQIVTE